MRDAKAFLGLVLFGFGQIWYALYGLRFGLLGAALNGLNGFGALVAAAGVVSLGRGHGHGLLAGGLTVMVLSGAHNLANLGGPPLIVLGSLAAGLGYLGLGVFALVWAASPKRGRVAVLGLRAAAGVAAASGLFYAAFQLTTGLAGWFLGNLAVLAGGALFAATFEARGADLNAGGAEPDPRAA